MEGVERHSQESQATIERERLASATVKQLKAEIKDEKAKHEEQVPPWTPSQPTCAHACSSEQVWQSRHWAARSHNNSRSGLPSGVLTHGSALLSTPGEWLARLLILWCHAPRGCSPSLSTCACSLLLDQSYFRSCLLDAHQHFQEHDRNGACLSCMWCCNCFLETTTSALLFPFPSSALSVKALAHHDYVCAQQMHSYASRVALHRCTINICTTSWFGTGCGVLRPSSASI